MAEPIAPPTVRSIFGALGLLTAVMTAFYMTRLFYLTFLGQITSHMPEFRSS